MEPAPDVSENMITIKVNYRGNTRKCKLPLRDMCTGTLEHMIRGFFDIPPSQDTLFERFSDSAGSYMVLDPDNHSVWKQLYRAAKAKSKLKLRVTDVNDHEQTVVDSDYQEAEQEQEHEHEPASSSSSSSTPPSTTVVGGPHAVTVEDEADAAAAEHLASHDSSSSPSLAPAPQRNLDTTHDFTRSESNRSLSCPYVAYPWTSALPDSGRAATFAVCCNSCDMTIPDEHFHCSICEDGDFDLCANCVESGVTCYGPGHWLIRRTLKDGQIVASTTEKSTRTWKSPSSNCQAQKAPVSPAAKKQAKKADAKAAKASVSVRTCNCCMNDYPDAFFVHCTSCSDFDLCRECFVGDTHGHHPRHAFVSAIENQSLPEHLTERMKPGRNVLHNAICDGCDKFITGIRHKCLDCPDWDYCNACVLNARFLHTNHRFVPLFEPLSDMPVSRESVHHGICCDGPLCAASGRAPEYISGVRYKCAVCHDTDFCAACEASPVNMHNKTHPLIKFKTPVRHVSVTTHGENQHGRIMEPMGDRPAGPAVIRVHSSCPAAAAAATDAAATVSRSPSPRIIAMHPSAQTVVDVKPEVSKASDVKSSDLKASEFKLSEFRPSEVHIPFSMAVPRVQPRVLEDLAAGYVCETVRDGTEFPPNHVFEQTWVLKNEGLIAWPAGCSVKFAGGDYMGHIEPIRPARDSELASASESNVCLKPVAPGESFSFTVLLRASTREGRQVSYWRLSTSDGYKFGDRLWCEIRSKAPAEPAQQTQQTPLVLPVRPSRPVSEEEAKVKIEPKDEEAEEEKTAETAEKPVEKSIEKPVETVEKTVEKPQTMIFPILEAESPETSVHQEAPTAPVSAAHEFEESDVLDEWDGSDDGFQTDEEYDILDASDEEFLEQQFKKLQK